MCSEIYHRELHEVVDAKTRVFAARLTKEDRDDDEDRVRRTFDVTDVRWVVGTGGTGAAAPAHLEFTYRVPVFRDEQGNITGHFSPILDASGKEGDAKKGEVWLFFTREEGDATRADARLDVYRLEPATAEKEVRDLAAALPKP